MLVRVLELIPRGPVANAEHCCLNWSWRGDKSIVNEKYDSKPLASLPTNWKKNTGNHLILKIKVNHLDCLQTVCLCVCLSLRERERERELLKNDERKKERKKIQEIKNERKCLTIQACVYYKALYCSRRQRIKRGGGSLLPHPPLSPLKNIEI